MRLIYSFGMALIAMGFVSRSLALDANSREGDWGAGPIRMYMTACLIANRTHQGKPCPEPAPAENGNQGERAASHMARAWYFIDMQDLANARAEVDAALSINPDDVKARHLAARISFTAGNLRQAEADLELALKRAPADPDIRATHAIILQSRPADLQSLRELMAIIDEHPEHLYAREQAALLCMKMGEFGAALANFTFVIEHRQTPELLAQRAEAFLALRRPLSAADDLSAALKGDPDDQIYMERRADAYAQAESYPLALRDYDALLAMDHGAPVWVMAENNRAKLLTKRAFTYVHLRRFDDAASDVIEAVNLGGSQAILRAQVMLRRNGFSQVSLDGQDSPDLRRALVACFGLDACFAGIMKAI